MAVVRKKVLVVDDDEDTRDSVADLFDVLGHDVFVAGAGPEAIGIAIEHEPDVVFIDIGLPGMSGHEVATRMRANAGTRPMRLIALSGWSQAEVVARSYAAGMDLHIVKPVGLLTLRGIVGDASGRTEDAPPWAEDTDVGERAVPLPRR